MKVSVELSNYFELIKAISRRDRKKNEIYLKANPGTTHSVTLTVNNQREAAVIKVIEGEICCVTLWDDLGEYATGIEITESNITESAKQITDYLYDPKGFSDAHSS